jgi:hypothetical protein
MNSPPHNPSSALPEHTASLANAALFIGLFAILPAMLAFNFYLMFAPWFPYLAIFGIGVALLVAGAVVCFRSQSKRLLGLLIAAIGATGAGIALNAEYWSAMGEESVPIVCEVHDRDGAAVAGARCQIIDAASGDPVGEGLSDGLGVARFNARLKLSIKFSWARTTQSLSSKYVVRSSASGFRLSNEPLAYEGSPNDRKVIAFPVILETTQ